MHKLFLPNKDYLFDADGNFKSDKKVAVNGDILPMSFSDTVVNCHLKWLGLIAHYEVDLPLNDLMKISFVGCNSKVLNIRCGCLMVFKQPISIDNGFRVIPGFTRHAVSVDGRVKSIKSGIIHNQRIGPYGYPYVNIYDPDKCKWRSVSVHILIARAYVFNPNPSVLCYVNHKDGNKLNYRPSNLEWTTSKSNVIHAVNNDLRNDNDQCLVRNIKTGEIVAFNSISQAMDYIGLKSNHKHINITINGTLRPRLFRKTYEIKMKGDTSPWFFTDAGESDSCNVNVGPYQVLNTATNEVTEHASAKEVGELIGITADNVHRVLKLPTPKTIRGYLIRTLSSKEWPTTYEAVKYTPPRKFIVTELSTGETHQYDSLRELRKCLGLDKRTLKNRLENNKPYNGWKIMEIVPSPSESVGSDESLLIAGNP